MARSPKMSQMNEEERLLFMQQKLLAEEEEAKKKEDMLTQFLKDKLAKEERNSAINLNKLTLQWRTILREAKAKELRKDMEILSQTFERVVDCKDNVIKSLAKDVQEAEEQYSYTLRSHLHNVDQLIHLQRQRLEHLKQEYDAEVETLTEEFESERKVIINQSITESNYLQNVLLAMEQNYTENEFEARQEFESLKDDIKNKNLEEKHALRIQLEGLVEDLWKQFQHALKNYNDSTEDRKIAFEALKLRDEKSAREIDMQMKKLQKLQESIAVLRIKIAQHARESEEQNRRLREEKEIIHKHFQKLKGQMNQARANERNRLAMLTLQSNAAIKEMKRIVAKGDQILRLTEMCRKLETEEEKVLPFYVSSLSPEEEEEVQQISMEKPSEQLAELMELYVSLDEFWKRYNKLQLDRCTLDREKAILTQDNQKLRFLLKQYLDGISVNDEVMSQLNPLLILNNKSNIQMHVPVTESRVKRARPPVVEAAHVVQHCL
ncbi:dynein regulatory complex subunit 2 isoform X1 [Microcaecilia unicolor]|uniref:Dynein regulatory complex subunit 2 n=1 Tax=Microcaecilia unicolor TaxID=1415580 RepID=A0A6P7XF57_9AMPH|nr:dynein regulatory complex subunit 2 isoform X1 [Microcaecilia unicolor]